MFDRHGTQNDTYFETDGVDANKMSTRAYQKDRKGHAGPSQTEMARKRSQPPHKNERELQSASQFILHNDHWGGAR